MLHKNHHCLPLKDGYNEPYLILHSRTSEPHVCFHFKRPAGVDNSPVVMGMPFTRRLKRLADSTGQGHTKVTKVKTIL